MIRSFLILVATLVVACVAAHGAPTSYVYPNNGNVNQQVTIPGFGTMSMTSSNSTYGAFVSGYFSTPNLQVVGQNSFLMPGYEAGHTRFEINTFVKWLPIDMSQQGYNSQSFNIDLRPMMNVALSGSTSLEHQRRWSIIDSASSNVNIAGAVVNYGYVYTDTYNYAYEKGLVEDNAYMAGASPSAWNTMIRTMYDLTMVDSSLVITEPVQVGAVIEAAAVPEPGAAALFLACTPFLLLRRRPQLATA